MIKGTLINLRAIDVVSDSGYVSAGARVVVREVHGTRVVVRAARS